MNARSARPDVVYVPPLPGHLISPGSPATGGDDIDAVLDDLFGADDPGGPSITDAILVAVGLGMLTVSVVKHWTAVQVLGVVLVGLGMVLPIRSVARHLGDRRQRARTGSTIGDALALRQDHPVLRRIADLHERILERSEALVPETRTRVVAVAHGLVEEVARLLGGELPTGDAEIDYVEARARSMSELSATVDDPRVARADDVVRRALSEARIEIERIAGTSALTDSAALRDELLADGDV